MFRFIILSLFTFCLSSIYSIAQDNCFEGEDIYVYEEIDTISVCQYATYIREVYRSTTTVYNMGELYSESKSIGYACEPNNGVLLIEEEDFYYEEDYVIETVIHSGTIQQVYYIPNEEFVGLDTLAFCVNEDHPSSEFATYCFITIVDVKNDCIDCEGVIGGSMLADSCGVCFENPLNTSFNQSCTDCAGFIYGESVVDSCGVCTLPGNFNASCTDCQGTLFGEHELDECGNCLSSNDDNFNACLDCFGIPNGSGTVDSCGICLEPTNPEFNACLDTIGVAVKTIAFDSKVYPNPASNFIHIENSGITQINIFDLNGKAIFSNKVENRDKTQINCSSWRSGIYFIQIENKEDQQFWQKIIVE